MCTRLTVQLFLKVLKESFLFEKVASKLVAL
jgi:hypothetical protein